MDRNDSFGAVKLINPENNLKSSIIERRVFRSIRRLDLDFVEVVIEHF
jgi:hypothetical protein